jgi:outer membrane protein OmpA-like peptidoglycan-associated protein
MASVQRSRMRGLFVALVVAVPLTAGLAGCAQGKEARPMGIAFVVGDRGNSAVVDAVALASLVPTNLPLGSIVTVTGVSGSPDGVPGKGFTFTDMGNPTDNQNELLTYRALLAKSFTRVKATTAQADVLGAVAAAERSIAGVGKVKRIIVADSLISTSGVLSFQNNLLSAPAEDVVASVPARDLPTLTGTAITLVGQGDTVLPQQPLSIVDRTSLRQIWAGLLHRSGAKSVTYVDTPSTGKKTAGVLPVTVAPVSEVGPVSFPAPCTAVIPQTRIQFKVGTAEFTFPEAASTEIAAVATALKGCKGQVTVAGTTSSEGSAALNQRLSLSRATTVRSRLAPLMGRPIDTIVVQGLGASFPGFLPDVNADGTLNVAVAEKNRTCIITVL